MKSVIYKILFVLFLLMFFVGGYMTINYMSNVKMLLIFLGVTVVGLGGIILEIVFYVKRKARSDEQADEENLDDNQ